MPNVAAEIVLRPSSADPPAILSAPTNQLDHAAALVLDAVGSDNNRRACRRALRGGVDDTLGFLPWLVVTPCGHATTQSAPAAFDIMGGLGPGQAARQTRDLRPGPHWRPRRLPPTTATTG